MMRLDKLDDVLFKDDLGMVDHGQDCIVGLPIDYD